MKATILRVKNQSFVAKSESNHWFPVDTNEKGGGANAASSPVELLLVACGTCVAMDMVSIIEKSRKEMTRFEMAMEADRAVAHPRIFREVRYHAIIESTDLPLDTLKRAMELSLTKYCSVSLSLDRSIRLKAKFTLNGTESETWEIVRGVEYYT